MRRVQQLNQTGRGGKFGSLYFLFFFQGRGGRCEVGEWTAGAPDPCLSHLPPQARSPGSSSDPGRAAGERRPPPDSVPAGSRRRGAATGGGQPCEVPEAPSHLVSLGLAGGGWGLPAPDGSSLPSRPLPPCAPVADLSVFLGHVFLTCCSPPSPTAAAPSAPRPAPPWYPARPEPGLGPSAIYFQATVGFSVFTACLSLNGKSPTQLSSRGAVRGGGRA